jgi:hypothetical protein
MNASRRFRPTRPERFRSVRLRCGSCWRLLDTAENGIRGYYVLGGREHNMIAPRVTQDGAAYWCKCGAEHQVSPSRVAELAPRAYEAGRDLFAGLRDYGLSL